MRFAQALLIGCAMGLLASPVLAEDAPPPPAVVPGPAGASGPPPGPAVPPPPASQVEAATAPSKLPKPVEQLAFVPSAEKRTVWFVSSINPDCASLGVTAYRVLTKPQHGDVTMENGTGFSYFPSGIREHCNSEKVAGLLVNYQSNPDFVGEDRFSVLFLIPPTLAKIVEFDMIVR